jgi:hypothetical protein
MGKSGELSGPPGDECEERFWKTIRALLTRSAFTVPDHPTITQLSLDERLALKSTVEPRITYPERRPFGRAARSLF